MRSEANPALLSVEVHGSRIDVEGELDLGTIGLLIEVMEHLVSRTDGDIELNIRGVRFLDAYCVAQLEAVAADLAGAGRTLRMAGAGLRASRVLALLDGVRPIQIVRLR